MLKIFCPVQSDEIPLTLNSLGELIQRSRGGGHVTRYSDFSDCIKKSFGDESIPRSYWALMTKDVLPYSRDKPYKDQCALVASYQERTGLVYEVPHILEAAVSILMHHAKTGERCYGMNPLTYSRCQEEDGYGNQTKIGGLASVSEFKSGRGICIFSAYHDWDSWNTGVAGIQRF